LVAVNKATPSAYNRYMVLQILLFGIHLLCVNIAAAGPLVCPLLQWRAASTGDPAVNRIGRQLLALSLVGFFLGTIAGLFNGLLWWNNAPERLLGAMERLSSKIYFAWWELGFYLFCLAIYWAWWRWAPPRRKFARIFHGLFAWMAATNLLWHFPPLMTILIHVAANAPLGEPIDASEFRQLMFSSEIFSRCAHVWMASIATAGIAVALLAARSRPKSQSASPAVESCVMTGGRLALIATLLQVVVGAWVLFTSPTQEQSRLLGDDLMATSLLIISIAATLWLMHLLGAIAVGPAESKQIVTAGLLLTLIVFTMSATLILARGGVLQLPIEADMVFHSSPNRIWQ
jgi:hypothetical protein